MILVGQYDSPYTRRVAVSLHLLGLQFTRDTSSVFSNADHVRTINPLGRVPALVLADGEVLIESSAILDYLDETVGPARALLLASGPERRAALRTIAIATGGMGKAVAIIYERFLRPAEKLHQAWLDRCETQLAAAFAYLDAQPLAEGLQAGHKPQAAIAAVCLMSLVRLRIPDQLPIGRYHRLDDLAAQAESRPAFLACRPSPDDTAPGRG